MTLDFAACVNDALYVYKDNKLMRVLILTLNNFNGN